MIRTQIYFVDEQRRRMRAWSKMEKKTASALIRTAIQEQYVQRPTPADSKPAMNQALGAWAKRKKSSLSIVRNLRRGKRLDGLAG